jgi:hypothetical protein
MTYAREPELIAEIPKPEYTVSEKESLGIRAAWESGDERSYFDIQSTKANPFFASIAFTACCQHPRGIALKEERLRNIK